MSELTEKIRSRQKGKSHSQVFKDLTLDDLYKMAADELEAYEQEPV